LNVPELEPENNNEKEEKNEINLIFTRLVSSNDVLGKPYPELPF